MATVEQAALRVYSPNRETNPLAAELVGLFHQRLNGIKPFDDRRGHDEVGRLGQLGITYVRRRAFAVAFTPGEWDMPHELWIDDPKDVKDHSYPHTQVQENVINYLRRKKITPEDFVSGEVIQDGSDDLYLIINPSVGRQIKNIACNQGDLGRYNKMRLLMWLSLLERYGIKKVIGDDDLGYYASSNPLYMTRPEFVLGIDLLGQLRGDRFLLGFADEYHMTHTQFCRFTALVRSVQDTNIPVNYERLAKEVAEKK